MKKPISLQSCKELFEQYATISAMLTSIEVDAMSKSTGNLDLSRISDSIRGVRLFAEMLDDRLWELFDE